MCRELVIKEFKYYAIFLELTVSLTYNATLETSCISLLSSKFKFVSIKVIITNRLY
jgi:hypothetical protein